MGFAGLTPGNEPLKFSKVMLNNLIGSQVRGTCILREPFAWSCCIINVSYPRARWPMVPIE